MPDNFLILEQMGIERYTRNFNYPDKSMIKSLKDIENLGIKTYFVQMSVTLIEEKYMRGLVDLLNELSLMRT